MDICTSSVILYSIRKAPRTSGRGQACLRSSYVTCRSDSIRSVECSVMYLRHPWCRSDFPTQMHAQCNPEPPTRASKTPFPRPRLFPLPQLFAFRDVHAFPHRRCGLAHDNPISANSRLRTIIPVGGAESQAPTAKVPSLPLLLGGGGGISNFVLSAIMRWKPIPTPSITAKRMAQPIAPFRIARGPPRTASAPPVKNPAMMAFQGSSFLRTPLTAQSKVENMPPQTPKLPPSTGARAFIAVIAVKRMY